MNLAHYDPFNLINEIAKGLDPTWRRAQNDASQVEGSSWAPATDIHEEDNQFVISTDLPGVKKENIQITMEENTLTIKGERKQEKTIKHGKYARQERIAGTFYRRFTLPETAQGEKIMAVLHNGVLEVRIPKKEAAQPRTIEVIEKKEE